MIAAVRSQVDPIDFFVLQLEMYERMNYVVDPVTSAEYRRFLYNFNHSEIMDSGDVDRLYLAYFPSPAITPRQARSRRSSSVSSISSALGMTSISRRGSTSSQKGKPDFSMSSSSTDLREESNANKPTSSTRNKAGSHFAMTARTSSYQEGSHVRGMLNQHSEEQPNQSEIKEVQQTPQSSAPRDSSEFLDNKRRHEAKEMMNSKEKLMKIGQGRTLPLQGKRLRCKMCR